MGFATGSISGTNGIYVTENTTETWETMFANNSGSYISQPDSSNEPRRFDISGMIGVADGGQLTIEDAVIVSVAARCGFRPDFDDGNGGGTLIIRNSQLHWNGPNWNANKDDGNSFFLGAWGETTSSADKADNTATINLYHTSIFWESGGSGSKMHPGNMYNCIIHGREPADGPTTTNAKRRLMGIKEGQIWRGCYFRNLAVCEIIGAPVTIENCIFDTVLIPIYVWNDNYDEPVELTVRGIQASGYQGLWFLASNDPGNSSVSSILHLQNSKVPNPLAESYGIYHPWAGASFPPERFYALEEWTAKYRVLDTSLNPIQDVKIYYENTYSASPWTETTDANGDHDEISVVVRRTTGTGDDVPADLNIVNYGAGGGGPQTKEVIVSYGHYGTSANLDFDYQIGTDNADGTVNPIILQLQADVVIDASGITYATANAYTHTTINHTTQTITSAAAAPSVQRYCKAKADYYNNPGETLAIASSLGNTFTVASGYDLVIADPSHIVDGKTWELTGSSEITLSQAGDHTGFIGSLGASNVVNVVAGTTNLTGWSFESGATIACASGSATVTISSDPGISTSGDVTLQTPTVQLARGVSGAPVGSSILIAQRSELGIVDRAQFTLAAGNDSGDSTLVIQETIPADTPSSGHVRVVASDESEQRYAYTSFSGSTFTLSGTLSQSYTNSDTCYVGYIDVIDSATGDESVDLDYVSDRDVVLRVRLGSGVNKIKDITQNYTISNADSVIPVQGIEDTINNN